MGSEAVPAAVTHLPQPPKMLLLCSDVTRKHLPSGLAAILSLENTPLPVRSL